jgi:hypothetical protein
MYQKYVSYTGQKISRIINPLLHYLKLIPLWQNTLQLWFKDFNTHLLLGKLHQSKTVAKLTWISSWYLAGETKAPKSMRTGHLPQESVLIFHIMFLSSYFEKCCDHLPLHNTPSEINVPQNLCCNRLGTHLLPRKQYSLSTYYTI